MLLTPQRSYNKTHRNWKIVNAKAGAVLHHLDAFGRNKPVSHVCSFIEKSRHLLTEETQSRHGLIPLRQVDAHIPRYTHL